MRAGTLFGVGVGPGDPELMTVKAWRLISTAPVVAFLVANGKDSTARNIAKPFLPDDTTLLPIDMPMSLDLAPGEAAYDRGAVEISHHLQAGRDVVFLCEGDPFFYGSFMYLHQRLSPRFSTVVVPGVSSITTAAAAMGRPLAARSQSVKVLPATMDAGRLANELSNCDTVAIIKVGRHFGPIRSVLQDLGLADRATLVEKASCDDQSVTPINDVDAQAVPYFSTIIIHAGSP